MSKIYTPRLTSLWLPFVKAVLFTATSCSCGVPTVPGGQEMYTCDTWRGGECKWGGEKRWGRGGIWYLKPSGILIIRQIGLWVYFSEILVTWTSYKISPNWYSQVLIAVIKVVLAAYTYKCHWRSGQWQCYDGCSTMAGSYVYRVAASFIIT